MKKPISLLRLLNEHGFVLEGTRCYTAGHCVPDRNLLRNMFTEESKRFHPNWRLVAAQHVGI